MKNGAKGGVPGADLISTIESKTNVSNFGNMDGLIFLPF